MIFRIYPWEYTDKEGGIYKRWTGGPVCKFTLLHMLGKSTVKINEVDVHSLIFETAIVGPQYSGRWDCVNGWTTTLKEAHKRWPNVVQGRKPYWVE